MFLEESALDEVDDRPVSKFSRPSTAQTNSLTLQDAELDEDDSAYRSAGTLNSASSSRARMLAQQRELQLKKRQNVMHSNGMIRSSVDSSVGTPSKGSATDGQFTPAVRQFSAPKAVRESQEGPVISEFSRPKETPKSKEVRKSRYSDEEEEDDRRRNKSRNRDDDDSESLRKDVRNMRVDERDRDRDRDRDREKDRERDRRERERREEREREKEREKERRRDELRRRDRDDRKSKKYDDDEDEEEDDDDQGYSYGGSSKPKDKRDKDRDRDRERDRDRDREKDRTTGRKDDRMKDRDDRGWDGPKRDDRPSTEDPAPTPSRPVSIPPDLSDMRRFLLNPVPKECGIVQCHIRRNRSGTNKLFPIYSLYLKEGDRFLMASRKRPKNKTSNYLISMDQNDLNRSGHNYLGKLRSNFVGTEFQVFDDGVNPKESEADEGPGGHNTAIRCEMGAVMYAANVLGSRGPRKMQVAIPSVDENNIITKWRDGQGPPSGNGIGEDMLNRMKDRNFRDLVYLINKPPRWNEQVGAYVLNFNGRVTMASVKNFQLVDPEEQNAVVLQFGRVGKDEFTMDLQWPISPFQAFAVTLSSFDSKIACD